MTSARRHIHLLIRANEHDDPTDTAVAVMDTIGLTGEHRDLLLPLLRDECRRLARASTRDCEYASGLGPGHHSPGNHSGSARSDLLAQSFYNGEKWVRWGDATITDHEGRIAFQETLRAGIDNDIARHRMAIDVIRRVQGAQCLDDVPPEQMPDIDDQDDDLDQGDQ